MDGDGSVFFSCLLPGPSSYPRRARGLGHKAGKQLLGALEEMLERCTSFER